MKSVFEASNGLDGHMVLNLLELHGIKGRIDGEYLQGGIGDLQAMGYVRVMVKEEDYDEARRIINEWETEQPPDAPPKSEMRTEAAMRIFIAGVFVGALLMYGLLRIVAA